MSEIKPTLEQQNIYDYIEKENGNLLIQAYAGSGKSYTLNQIAKLIPTECTVTFLAYNRHIKKELETKLPEHVRCYTTYGIGLAALKRKYKDIEFDEFKIDKILKKKSEGWNLFEEFEGNASKVERYVKNLKKISDLCRLTLTTNAKYIPSLCEKHGINETENNDIKRVLSILEVCLNDKKTYDYVDMVFMSAMDPKIWFFPQDVILVDECQDLSRAQQKIIERMLKKDKITGEILTRIIAVGDVNQSIYSFAGADDKSFEWFQKLPNITTLPLSVSFRCAKNIITEAQKIVPGINAMDTAPEGINREGSILDEAREGDFILCRTNAPLVRLFFHFLMEGKKVAIKGDNIGPLLLDMIEGSRTIPNLIDHWNNQLISYKNELVKHGVLNVEEHSGYNSLKDNIDTLFFITKFSSTIDDLKQNIQNIFHEDLEAIQLMSSHSSKGLEADRVFIALPDKMILPTSSPSQYKQEINLKYITITRAKKELIWDTIWNGY